jgi:hypothetical protein
MLGAFVLLTCGLDQRLAVLPSLGAWVGAVVLAFLIARRMTPRGSTAAGLVAAIFLAASPAHRAFATDVMLESLGACLSLAVLYAYLCAAQATGDGRCQGRMFGLALTALFLHKYNYWLLVLLALATSRIAERPGQWWRWIRQAKGWDLRGWGSKEVRHPLTLALAFFIALSLVFTVRGPRPLSILDHRISLYPPHGLIHIAYILLFLRGLGWWRSGVREWTDGLSAPAQEVVRWHCWPAAVWLLLPRHPSNFLWYLSPSNADSGQHFDVVEGVRNYARWLCEDYHLDVPSTVLALALCCAGLLAWRRLRPGGSAVALLFLLGLSLTVAHPNQKGRCLHSWIATTWILGGVGGAQMVCVVVRTGWNNVRPLFAIGGVGALAWMQMPALLSPGHALEGGPHPHHASLLDLTESYIPELANSRRATVLAAVPFRTLTQWALLQQTGSLARLEEHWWDFAADSPAERESFLRWLQTTECETLVFLERLPGKAPWVVGPECDRHAGLLDLLRDQEQFLLSKQRAFPHHHCRVLVWQRPRTYCVSAESLKHP